MGKGIKPEHRFDHCAERHRRHDRRNEAVVLRVEDVEWFTGEGFIDPDKFDAEIAWRKPEADVSNLVAIERDAEGRKDVSN